MKIYTIIVTYNAMRWIDRCLKSLQESTVSTSVIIIDNRSTDGTREYIPKHYKDIIWMPQETNFGFGQANNIGLRYALKHNADFVLLLNQDGSLHPNALQHMLDASDGDSLVAPLQLNGDGTRLDEMFRSVFRNTSSTIIDDILISNKLNKSYQMGEIGAACWFMPIRLINNIGGFNPLFFQYSEDNNYYQRMLYHRVKVLLAPHAHMYHDRILHGNVQAYNNKRIRRDLIFTICNINKSLWICIANCLRIFARCYIHELPRHKYIPGTYLMGILWIIFHIPSIIKSRHKEKAIGQNWL